MDPVPASSIAYFKNESLVIRSRRKTEKAFESSTSAEMQAWDCSI
jgi:serine O-acetyltransferase